MDAVLKSGKAPQVRKATSELNAGAINKDQLSDRIADILENPPSDIRLASIDQATYQTFTKTPGDLAQLIQKAKGKYQFFHLFDGDKTGIQTFKNSGDSERRDDQGTHHTAGRRIVFLDLPLPFRTHTQGTLQSVNLAQPQDLVFPGCHVIQHRLIPPCRLRVSLARI